MRILKLFALLFAAGVANGLPSVAGAQAQRADAAVLDDRIAHLDSQTTRQTKALESLDRRIQARDGWNAPATVIALSSALVSLFSLGFAVRQFEANRKEQRASLDAQLRNSTQNTLLESLRWFEGGIQKRSIGIAIVNGNWSLHNDLKPTWASVLLSQAVYITSKPDPKLPEHELQNLRSILALLASAARERSFSLLYGSVEVTLEEAFRGAQDQRTRYLDDHEITHEERRPIRSQLSEIWSEYKPLFT